MLHAGQAPFDIRPATAGTVGEATDRSQTCAHNMPHSAFGRPVRAWVWGGTWGEATGVKGYEGTPGVVVPHSPHKPHSQHANLQDDQDYMMNSTHPR